jgi:hypothetical protein
MDYSVVFLVAGVIIAAGGLIGTLFYSKVLRRSNKGSLQLEIEEAQRQKTKDEKVTADALAGSAAALAQNVKQDMKDHIDRLIKIMQSDTEMQRVQTYAKLDSLDTKIAQVKIDLIEHIINEKDDRLRMQRSIDFLQTMNFGPEAKSIPDYMMGEEETEEHKKEAEKGVFASRKDTTEEDNKDPNSS